MSANSLLTPDGLARAAYLLMSSSAQGRYRRMARQIAEEEGLTRRLREDANFATIAFGRLAELWRELLDAVTRDVQEFEIAVLLVALADAETPGLVELLHDVKASRGSSTIWLEGLARHLLTELHAQYLAKGVAEWMARAHNDIPAFEPDRLVRARLEAA